MSSVVFVLLSGHLPMLLSNNFDTGQYAYTFHLETVPSESFGNFVMGK